MKTETIKLQQLNLKLNILKSTAIVVLMILIVQPVFSKPRNITWDDLEQLKDGKEPKHSTKVLGSGLFSSSTLEVEVSTPRARAAKWTHYAKENYLKLDSTSFNPDKFNNYVQLHASNIGVIVGTLESKYISKVSRLILVINDEVHEADSSDFIKTTLQNAYGAEVVNIEGVFLFPIELFDGKNDIKIVVFDDGSKVERKLKKKDVRKLE